MRLAQRYGEDSPQEVIAFHKAKAVYDIQGMIERYFVRVVAIFVLCEDVGVVFEEIQ